jgi:hypothetical protein
MNSGTGFRKSRWANRIIGVWPCTAAHPRVERDLYRGHESGQRRAIDDAFLERRVQAFMTETFTLTLVPEKYCVWRDGIPSKLTIARRSDTTWAVVSRSGYVVNTDGELETEPSPSIRAKDFLDRTRVETIDDALARAKLYFQLYGADA